MTRDESKELYLSKLREILKSPIRKLTIKDAIDSGIDVYDLVQHDGRLGKFNIRPRHTALAFLTFDDSITIESFASGVLGYARGYADASKKIDIPDETISPEQKPTGIQIAKDVFADYIRMATDEHVDKLNEIKQSQEFDDNEWAMLPSHHYLSLYQLAKNVESLKTVYQWLCDERAFVTLSSVITKCHTWARMLPQISSNAEDDYSARLVHRHISSMLSTLEKIQKETEHE